MSAKDDLDKFDRDWNHHLRWRSGESRGFSVETGEHQPRAPGGKYVSPEKASYGCDVCLVLKELPLALRDAVRADLEATVGALIDSKKVAIRRDLVKAAALEARRTLEELEKLEELG